MKVELKNAWPLINQLAREWSESGGMSDRQAQLQMWRDYIRHYNDKPEGYIGLGESSADGEDYSTAVAAFTRAIDLGAKRPELFYQRGLSAERIGDHELAHRDAQMTLKMNPTDKKANALLKLTRGRPSTNYIDLHTGRLLAAAAAVAPRRGNDGGVPAYPPAGSIPAAEPAADPIRKSAVQTQSAQRHLQLGDMNAAIAAAQSAVELNPRNAQAHNLLATAHERKGDHKAAVESASKSLELQPGSVPALNTRAWAKSAQHHYDSALGDASAIIAADPYNAFGHVNKARALGGLGQRPKMLESLHQAARLDGRFEPLRDRALQLAADSDTELLFSGLFGGTTKPPPPRRPSRKNRFLLLAVSCVIGGLLVAAGALHVFSPAWRERVRTTLGMPRRRPCAEGASAAALDGYTIRRVIATGGMGVVYEAEDRKLGRRVAIKKLRGEIRADPKERDRFLMEARTVASLTHPNIVQIHSIIDDEQDIYLVFEYAEGRTLRELLSENKRLSWNETRDIFRGVCRALEYAHTRKIVHRDLKPSNIMVDEKGEAKVMDFGVARGVKDAVTRAAVTNTVWGTPSYMSPEMEEGEIRPESDVFALGVCFYETLTGKTPFQGTAGAMYQAKTTARYAPASSLAADTPRGLDEALRSALEPDPRKRLRSADEFWSAIRVLS